MIRQRKYVLTKEEKAAMDYAYARYMEGKIDIHDQIWFVGKIDSGKLEEVKEEIYAIK